MLDTHHGISDVGAVRQLCYTHHGIFDVGAVRQLC